MLRVNRGKATPSVKKVWRISKSAPRGEWVEVTVAPAAPVRDDDLPEVSTGSWVTSSYDLLSGSEVIEDPDTVPGDLFDQLFAPVRNEPKATG